MIGDSQTIVPGQPPVPIDVLNKVRAIVGEHFDDFLIVVAKDGEVYSSYKAKCSAFGMASMIVSDINHSWWLNRSDKI